MKRTLLAILLTVPSHAADIFLVAPAAVHAPCTPMAWVYDAGSVRLECAGIIFRGGFE